MKTEISKDLSESELEFARDSFWRVKTRFSCTLPAKIAETLSLSEISVEGGEVSGS